MPIISRKVIKAISQNDQMSNWNIYIYNLKARDIFEFSMFNIFCSSKLNGFQRSGKRFHFLFHLLKCSLKYLSLCWKKYMKIFPFKFVNFLFMAMNILYKNVPYIFWNNLLCITFLLGGSSKWHSNAVWSSGTIWNRNRNTFFFLLPQITKLVLTKF